MAYSADTIKMMNGTLLLRMLGLVYTNRIAGARPQRSKSKNNKTGSAYKRYYTQGFMLPAVLPILRLCRAEVIQIKKARSSNNVRK